MLSGAVHINSHLLAYLDSCIQDVGCDASVRTARQKDLRSVEAITELHMHQRGSVLASVADLPHG